MPESPDSLRSCASSTSRTSSTSRKAFMPRLRTELVLTLVLLIARRCIDARPVLIVWRERSSSVQSLYSSSRSRYRASSRSSRRASRRDDEVESSCAARGKLAGCSGVDGGSRRYERMCAYLQGCQMRLNTKKGHTYGALGRSKKIWRLAEVCTSPVDVRC